MCSCVLWNYGFIWRVTELTLLMVSNYILVLVSKIRFVQYHAAFPDSPHQRFLQVEVAFSALADLEENPPMPRSHRTFFPKVKTGILRLALETCCPWSGAIRLKTLWLARIRRPARAPSIRRCYQWSFTIPCKSASQWNRGETTHLPNVIFWALPKSKAPISCRIFFGAMCRFRNAKTHGPQLMQGLLLEINIARDNGWLEC